MAKALENRFLFSHHYLERIYQEADDKTEAAQLVVDLRGWASGWDDSSLSSLISTQVGPTLVSLGFNYREPSGGEDPHLLRLHTSYRQENQVALCYVAHREDGETDLDSTIKGRHYAAEIIHALKEEELSWGLLTDGERWRIYHADELAPYETFFEIDLGQLVTDRGGAGRGDTAYLLHTLFTKSAFEVDEDGECALDRHLTASEKEASAIEKHLSDCIEDVLRDLCQGFVEHDGRETYTSDQRDEVFRNATVLLYRLLFILYAEARDLLPLEVPEYHSASLDALVEQAAQYVKVTGLPDPDGTELWQNLSDLCSWVNSGDEDHHIPAYNGDLFDDSDKLYIHDHTIADKYLAPALFSLDAIEDRSESGYRRIDYRDLSVRHLGSIYEGLLEYKLFIAQEKRVRRSDGKGGYTFPKLSDTRLKKGEEDQVIEVGEVYFGDSAGERKAMGAYYTPEYIVDYMVQQTVRRGLEERRASLEEQLPGWLEEVETAPPGEKKRLQRVVDQKLLDFVERDVLTFRVCDPAMGSGHFLVNAVHTITTFIVETLNLTPWVNAEIDSDPVKWRRRVAKRCLYGVDLNALAVELAKLSLWLTTVAKGKPLNFLDHHLRQGNSLIGARLQDLIGLLDERTDEEKERLSAGQMSMFDQSPAFRAPLTEAIDLVRRISVQVADAAEDVESQAAVYEQVRRELKPYRDLADLVTAQHFGLDVDDSQLLTIAHCLLEDKSRLTEGLRALLNQAHELARSRSFFHWDLEFPEVFTDLERSTWKEESGFQAMVGNPPYDVLAQKELGHPVALQKQYFEETPAFAPAIGRKLNLYRLFICAGVERTRSSGRLSLIVPMSLLANLQTEPLRRFLVQDFQFETIDAFPQKDNPHKRVFFEAKLPTCIIVLQKSKPTRLTRVRVHPGKRLDEVKQAYSFSLEQIREFDPNYLSIPLVSQEEWNLAMNLDQDPALLPLGSVAESRQGEVNLTGDREYLSESPPGELILRGANIGPYQIYARPKQGTPMYLDAAAFLADSEHGSKAFDHQSERLAYQNSAAIGNYRRLIGTIVPKGKFCSHSISYFVESEYPLRSLLALFNSQVADWRFGLTSTSNFVSAYEVEAIPVPRFDLSDVTSNRQEESSGKSRLYQQGIQSGDFSLVLDWVTDRVADAARRPANEEAIRVYGGEVCRLLSYLAGQMLHLYERRQTLEDQVDVFRFADRDESFVPINDAFILDARTRMESPMELEAVHHDIDGLRLVSNADGSWVLELQAKFRDEGQGWRDHIKEEDGHMIKREWVPAYWLDMSEERARFYRYALPRLQDFDNASSFPGGYTRSTLKKLHLTKVPMMPDVDLSDLARLDQELTETKRKIELTDDLIDQIVYKLYGLTEKEIAIVEGQT